MNSLRSDDRIYYLIKIFLIKCEYIYKVKLNNYKTLYIYDFCFIFEFEINFISKLRFLFARHEFLLSHLLKPHLSSCVA